MKGGDHGVQPLGIGELDAVLSARAAALAGVPAADREVAAARALGRLLEMVRRDAAEEARL